MSKVFNPGYFKKQCLAFRAGQILGESEMDKWLRDVINVMVGSENMAISKVKDPKILDLGANEMQKYMNAMTLTALKMINKTHTSLFQGLVYI